jgi:hypothetical protein
MTSIATPTPEQRHCRARVLEEAHRIVDARERYGPDVLPEEFDRICRVVAHRFFMRETQHLRDRRAHVYQMELFLRPVSYCIGPLGFLPLALSEGTRSMLAMLDEEIGRVAEAYGLCVRGDGGNDDQRAPLGNGA